MRCRATSTGHSGPAEDPSTPPTEIKALVSQWMESTMERCAPPSLSRYQIGCIQPGTPPQIFGGNPALVPGRDNLASALRASIAASTHWETGWVAMRIAPSGMCLAGRENQRRELRPGEYVNLARHGMPVAPEITSPSRKRWNGSMSPQASGAQDPDC